MLRQRFFPPLIAMVLTLLLAALLPHRFSGFENLLGDWRTRTLAHDGRETRLVIIDIDERSIAQIGAWPWPRDVMAQLVASLLDQYHMNWIVLDMVFPQPRPGDAELALQLRRPQVIGGMVFDLQVGSPHRSGQLRGIPPPAIAAGYPLPLANGFIASHPAFQLNTSGHITPITDIDGRLRRINPIICATGGCLPSLALAAYLRIAGGEMAIRPGHGLLDSAWRLDLSSGPSLPLEAGGALTIPYRHHRESWISISAADVLTGRAEPALLKGGIALVGSTALGLSDTIATPLAAVAAGIEPHAEFFSALLDGEFMTTPRIAPILSALLLLPSGLLLALGMTRAQRPLKKLISLPLWLTFAAVLGFGLNLALAHYAGIYLPLAPIVAYLALVILIDVSWELYRAAFEREGILAQFAAYLPASVVSRLALDQRVNDAIDATRRPVTVLFADIQDFSSMAENQTPEVVARLMQRVFAEFAEAVARHGGTVDKFIGDAVMALWNAPEDDPEHVAHALDAAQEILERIEGLEAFCSGLGLTAIRVGIGIESGMALVGHFGSPLRRTYTALGEPVNLASRLQRLTREQGHPVLVGQGAERLAAPGLLLKVGEFSLRGRSMPLAVYTPDFPEKKEARACNT